ncbi:hypothetical protein [Cytobacillus sp. FSL K6-0265]|uniref:hypothetical protein n=1 Tax=Cytobacillus sp. FSL K6-0265 TaxID=2921448 RepID=UPI0030F77487
MILLSVIIYIAYYYINNNRLVSAVYSFRGEGTDWLVTSKYTSIHQNNYRHEVIIEYTGDEENVLVDRWLYRSPQFGTGGGEQTLDENNQLSKRDEGTFMFTPNKMHTFEIEWNGNKEKFDVNLLKND